MKSRRSDSVACLLRLYVAAGSPSSHRAISNLRAFCAKHFPDSAKIEIVDVVKEPQRALKEGVFVTPTLIRVQPQPQRIVIGDLRDEATLAAALGNEELTH